MCDRLFLCAPLRVLTVPTDTRQSAAVLVFGQSHDHGTLTPPCTSDTTQRSLTHRTADDFRHDVYGASHDGHDGSLLLSDVSREGQHNEHRDIRGGARPA